MKGANLADGAKLFKKKAQPVHGGFQQQRMFDFKNIFAAVLKFVTLIMFFDKVPTEDLSCII